MQVRFDSSFSPIQLDQLFMVLKDHFIFVLCAVVAYVKRLNIPSGVVGACRLDLAYEHFKVLLVLCIYNLCSYKCTHSGCFSICDGLHYVSM